jgi:phosphopentomutase
VGKIRDIFAGRGLTGHVYTESDADGMARTLEALGRVERGLIFTNLVDFDMLYGHRLDAAGFGRALEAFDRWLPELLSRLLATDLLIVTADHGCDPTTPGTDHTREHVPLLVWHRGVGEGGDLGTRESFADVAATVAAALGLTWRIGESVLGELRAEGGVQRCGSIPPAAR